MGEGICKGNSQQVVNIQNVKITHTTQHQKMSRLIKKISREPE